MNEFINQRQAVQKLQRQHQTLQQYYKLIILNCFIVQHNVNAFRLQIIHFYLSLLWFALKTTPVAQKQLNQAMDPSSRLKKHPPAKQNSSLRANRIKIKIKHISKNTPKVQTAPSNSTNISQIPQFIQKLQTKKQIIKKQGQRYLQTRMHIYNMNEIIEIRDLRTGKSEFKSKQTIKYVMDDYNEILKLGNILLNVSPFSSNVYKKTEWRFMSDQEQDKQCIKTECTSKVQKCDQKDQDYKFERICNKSKAKVTEISKSQELHKGFHKFNIQCQSKSFELFQKYNNDTSEGNNPCCPNQTISQSQNQTLKK